MKDLGSSKQLRFTVCGKETLFMQIRFTMYGKETLFIQARFTMYGKETFYIEPLENQRLFD